MSSSGKTVIDRQAYDSIAVGYMLLDAVKLINPCVKLIDGTTARSRAGELAEAYTTIHSITAELVDAVEPAGAEEVRG